MTNPPGDLATFRTGKVIPATGLQGNDVGINPDSAHLGDGGYHVGCVDVQRIGRWNTDYSTRQQRDRLDGTNLASAMDIGDDWPNGGRPAWLRFNNLLVSQLRASDPALAALRAVNFSPDGSLRRRYDSLHPEQGVIPSTDSVTIHTHLEWWRNTAGTASRARSLARIGQIIDAAIRNTLVPPDGDEDDMGGFAKLDLEQGATNIAVPGGALGWKSPTYLAVCNDTFGVSYGLRIYTTTGDGSWTPIDADGLVLCESGHVYGFPLPEETRCVSIVRAGVRGTVVYDPTLPPPPPPTPGQPQPLPPPAPYAGHLSVALER
jgi:hypothetical protein